MAIYRKSDATRNAKADAQAAMYDGGILEWRTGPIPASPAVADSGVLLATNTCAATAFGAAVAGVVTYAADVPNTQVATGNIGHMRAKTSGGAVIGDFDVTTAGGGGAVIVDKLSVTAGEKVTVTSASITEPM